jgi:basic membrane protein A
MTRRASRWAVLALVALVAALAAGCGGSDETSGETTALKVGLVADAGELNDNGFNELAYKGLKRAERQLGIEGRVVQANSAADYVPNMTSLARQGYDLIIGVGFAQGDAIAAAAKRFPDTSFAIVDVDQSSLKGKPANVQGLLFREEQVGYLVGYLGALELKSQGGKQVMSAVGANNVPAIVHYISGYIQGAKKANPKVKVLANYANDPTFNDQSKCHETALNQIQQGSRVVFQVAGGCGLGALKAAKENKIWGIGVDADQRYLGPFMMTSALKRVDTAVETLTTLAYHGKLKTQKDYVFSLKNNGVGLGSVSPKIPKAFVAKTIAVGKLVGSGRIKVKPVVKF